MSMRPRKSGSLYTLLPICLVLLGCRVPLLADHPIQCQIPGGMKASRSSFLTEIGKTGSLSVLVLTSPNIDFDMRLTPSGRAGQPLTNGEKIQNKVPNKDLVSREWSWANLDSGKYKLEILARHGTAEDPCIISRKNSAKLRGVSANHDEVANNLICHVKSAEEDESGYNFSLDCPKGTNLPDTGEVKVQSRTYQFSRASCEPGAVCKIHINESLPASLKSTDRWTFPNIKSPSSSKLASNGRSSGAEYR